jgi:hypothetical protein
MIRPIAFAAVSVFAWGLAVPADASPARAPTPAPMRTSTRKLSSSRTGRVRRGFLTGWTLRDTAGHVYRFPATRLRAGHPGLGWVDISTFETPHPEPSARSLSSSATWDAMIGQLTSARIVLLAADVCDRCDRVPGGGQQARHRAPGQLNRSGRSCCVGTKEPGAGAGPDGAEPAASSRTPASARIHFGVLWSSFT